MTPDTGRSPVARHAGPAKRGVVAIAAALMMAATGHLGADDAAQDRANADMTFRHELAGLAAKCDELELKEQALVSREWCSPRDPRRHYLFLPPSEDPTRPAGDALQLTKYWHAKFTEIRQEQAQRLYDLAARQAEAGSEAVSYRLLHEVLREDPDHAEARRVLGYSRGERDWRRPMRKPKARATRTPHPLLGWSPSQYWRVDSEHFEVTTNASARAGRQVAEYLERVHAVWQQLFYEYWTVPGRLAARFAGQDVALGPERVFDVVLLKDRDDYVRQLSQAEPQIAMSVGYYSQQNKTSFFYAGDESARTTWVHEATHQFFQESGEVAPKVGEQSNFWVVEGVALYMESLADRGDYFTTGGIDADRLQYARYRVRNEGYYVPLETLVANGREQTQQDANIRQLYSQFAGLSHYFMHGQQGELLRPFIGYLRAVYRGVGQPETLTLETGRSYAELDERYREYLNVTDEDLAFVDRAVRNLCLGHTDVTDRGLALLHGMKRLEWLDLSFTAAGDAGLASFAECEELEQLNLEKTLITARSLEVVAGFRQLKELDLSQTAMGDEAMVALSKLTRLTVLWLTKTGVTDVGLSALTSLRNLERLDVEGTGVTSDALERLQRRLPKLKPK